MGHLVGTLTPNEVNEVNEVRWSNQATWVWRPSATVIETKKMMNSWDLAVGIVYEYMDTIYSYELNKE